MPRSGSAASRLPEANPTPPINRTERRPADNLRMRIAVLTSNEIRHRYVARALADEFDVRLVGYQETGYRPADIEPQTPSARTAAIVKHHFQERTRQERAFFGNNSRLLPAAHLLQLTPETLNSTATIDALAAAGAELVVIYGTSLIRPPLLDAFAGRMINLHLGLSPYYRGTATNFYPLVNDEPQYVGATVHLIDAGIDSGPILHQGRPDITADDMPHTAGCKAILVGVELLKRTLGEWEAGDVNPVPQWRMPSPRLYLRRHYRAEHVVRLYEMIEAGLFPRYAARKAQVEPRVRLVG